AAGCVARPRVATHAVQRGGADEGGRGVVLCGDHAAFTGRQVLGRVEAETGEVGNRTDLTAADRAFHAVRRVLDDHQAVGAGEPLERVEICRAPRVVHRQQHARGW